jgi:hypothetical protein
MASLPQTTAYYRESGQADDSWTEVVDGVFQGSRGKQYEIVCVGTSETRIVNINHLTPDLLPNTVAWFEPKIDYLYQDAAGTNLVSAAGEPIGKMISLEGGIDALQADLDLRPIYQVDGDGNSYISRDGIDDTISVLLPDLGDDAVVCYYNGREVVTLEQQTISGEYEIPARRNLMQRSDCYFGDGSWGKTSCDATNLSLNELGLFDGVSVASQGQTFQRLSGATEVLSAGEQYVATIYYKAGTSGKYRVYIKNENEGDASYVDGDVGGDDTFNSGAGTIAVASHTESEGVYMLVIDFTPIDSGEFTVAIGPGSAVAGETIIALGAQIEQGSTATPYQDTINNVVVEPIYRLTIHDGPLTEDEKTFLADYLSS